MTKSELRELIRECLQEELKACRLEENVKHIYYHNDPVTSLKNGHWIDVKEEDGKLYGKWSFEGDDDWHEITDMEEMPYHNLHGARPAKTFTWGGWRHWLDDEVEKFWDIEGKRVIGDFEIKGMPHVKRKTIQESTLTESSLTAEEKVDAWHNGTRRENYKAAGVPKLQSFLEIAKRKGYTEIVDILEAELKKRGVTVASSTAADASMKWEELLKKAGEFLYDIMEETDNLSYDDGDGYWQEEYTTWCDRCLYYTRLNNTELLSKLCDEYNMKLPNVEFYFYDDEDEEASEIGFVAKKILKI